MAPFLVASEMNQSLKIYKNVKLDVKLEHAKKPITQLESLMGSNANVAQLIMVSIVWNLLD